MLRPQGYGMLVSPVPHRAKLDFRCEDIKLGTNEFDTVTCNHCNCVFHVRPNTYADDMGGFCRICASLVCPVCVGKDCVTFLKKMEDMERKSYTRRQYEMAMSA